MKSEFESSTDHSMTEQEMREVLELYAQDQKERERLAGQPTVEEVSEALAVPTEKVTELLQRVRSREQVVEPVEPTLEPVQSTYSNQPIQPQPVFQPMLQDTYDEEIYVRRRYSQNPIVAIIALIIFGIIAFTMFSSFSRRADQMIGPFGGGSRSPRSGGWVESQDGTRIPISRDFPSSN